MHEHSRQFCACVVLCLITAEFTPSARGQNEPFYKGKTLRFVVGSAPANFYDSWARLIARYWGKHIPGNPNVIVQNMPGAGSITAVNYVYGVARADGLTVVLPNNSIYIEQLIGRREAQFDLRKYHWLGSAAQESIMFYMRADTPASHFGREPFNSWHKKGFDLHLLQSGRKRDPRAPEAPTLYEVLEEFKVPDGKRRVAQALLSGGEFGRPVFVTPGTPRDRIKILRDSFRNVMKDAELLAEAKKSRMDVEYTAGEELEALLKEVLSQPPEVIEQARKILGN